MRLLPIALLALACSLAAHAQTPDTPAPVDKRIYQKVERIHIDDGGTKIDEVRVGGQNQSITVRPLDMPAYEMQPTDLARSRPADRRDGFGGGSQRVWNLLNF